MLCYMKTHTTIQFNFRIDPVVKRALDTIYERDGIVPAEQIRRAVRVWITERGIALPAPMPRKGRR
jgi:hypothetical protein